MTNTNKEATIYIVDDDSSVLRSIGRLLLSMHYQVETFSSAQEFIDVGSYDSPSCLVLDVTMPGLSGLDLQEKLISSDVNIPIVFITGNASIPMSVRAMKGGAVNFLEKPFDQSELIMEITRALELGIQTTKEKLETSVIKERIELLTSREAQVFNLVVAGRLNKQIADDMGICEKTVKVHRAKVMEKMSAKSLADLVHLSDRVIAPSIDIQVENG